MRLLLPTVALACCLALPAAALTTNVPDTGLPTASHYATLLLPEKEGVVPWRTLSKVETEQIGIRMVNRFSNEILALDRQTVKIQGFMVPLDAGEKQRRFLISAVPPECPFCLPAGPEALVEVVAKKPVRYGGEPIVVSGRFEVVRDEEAGLLYRLSDAEAIGPAWSTPVATTAPKAGVGPSPKSDAKADTKAKR